MNRTIGRWLRRVSVVAVLAALVMPTAFALPAHALGTLRYPNLKTLPPRALKLDRTDVSVDGSGVMHNVLRFSNAAWNAGEGVFALRAQIDPATNSGTAYQRIYDDAGNYVDQAVGVIYYHAAHAHYHFEGWGKYELWTKAAYDQWVASGGTSGAPQWVSPKTTSCVLDEEAVDALPGTPATPQFPWTGCNLSADNTLSMGLSPGWADTYDYYRFEQWIDLGQDSLTDGQYVLRSVTDNNNSLYESDNKADLTREYDNNATTTVTISGGAVQDTDAPSGTVWINGVDTQTSNTKVNLKLTGRDDVSGVNAVRISNDGVSWSQAAYTGQDSTPMDVAWDLADTRYGGNASLGAHTVSVQFRDAAGKWSNTITDTITLVSCTAGSTSSSYANTVLADTPVSYWRVGESCGTTAFDAKGTNNGTYVNSPSLAQPSLLPADAASTAVSFNGTTQYAQVPQSASLNLGSAFSLEAWIRPNAIPAAGGWASVLTKPESYSIQFNGPRLEFTVIQNGTRRRLLAPTGAVAAGTTYHVVATYDGTTQRLYLNGAQVASAALTGAATSTTNPLQLASWDGTGEFFNGTIDDAAVYNRTLTASQVANHNSAGRSSAPTVPAAPSGLTAAAADASSVTLGWTDNSGNETGFVVERSTTSAFSTVVSKSVAPDVRTFTDSGLSASTTYYYRVKATNGTGDSGYSNTASATTPAPPPSVPVAPSGLAATASGPSAISLTWVDNATNETGYVLERSLSSTFASAVSQTLAAGATSATDSGLSGGTTYFYRVKATNSAGDSPYSATASATTTAPTTSTYASTIAADAPVSYWRLGEASGTVAADERQANPGTYVNGTLLGRPSLLPADATNTAATFDGVNDQVSIPSSSSLNFGTAFSLEAWIRPNAIPAAGGWASVLTKAEAYSIQFNGPRLEFTVIQNGTRRRLLAPSGAVAAGTTYHVVATYDGTTQRLYLDGSQVASAALTGAASTTTSPLRIGSWDGTGEFLNGTVDEVAVYNKALTATQVAAHNSKGRTA